MDSGLVSVRECVVCKQKTADEMRIRDWSSDVCSSDLGRDTDVEGCDLHFAHAIFPILITASCRFARNTHYAFLNSSFKGSVPESGRTRSRSNWSFVHHMRKSRMPSQIGRASCRERVCQYVYISVVAVSLKKKKKTKN